MTWSVANNILFFSTMLVSSVNIDVNADELFPTTNNSLNIDLPLTSVIGDNMDEQTTTIPK